jgi:hypothetical protein
VDQDLALSFAVPKFTHFAGFRVFKHHADSIKAWIPVVILYALDIFVGKPGKNPHS